MRRLDSRFQSALRESVLLGVMLSTGLFSACSGMKSTGLPTILPADYIPTAVALTLAASGVQQPSSSQTIVATIPRPSESAASTLISLPRTQTRSNHHPTEIATEVELTHTALPSFGETALAPSQTPTDSTTTPLIRSDPAKPLRVTPTFSKTQPVTEPTAAPAIPDARIQIYRLGDLSKVVSPLDVSLRLTCGDAKIVRIELHGEDGRLLARYVREYDSLPWEAARIGISMDFEISAAAELGRLIVSADDAFGRTIEVNSMNLILLSQGTTELNPPSGLQQQIIIQDPVEKALIQNGSLIISGRAHTETPEPLRVMLISEEGKILGQRLAAVTTETPGDYGQFITELPYQVDRITNASLVVYEEGTPASTIIHLTSLNVILVPK